MPNWCYNRLIVSGEGRAVDLFIEKNKGIGDDDNPASLSFSREIPEPEGRDADFDWYSWRIHNWGTSSLLEVSDVEITANSTGESNRRAATYIFSTSWSPPEAWLEKVSKRYPQLIFCITYGETGMNFGGSDIYKNGVLADSSQGKASDYLQKDMTFS